MKLEAWIDVGGTFTDCLVRRESGEILRIKTLSSSRVPVTAQPADRSLDHATEQVDCVELNSDCDDFWFGGTLCGLDGAGNQVFAAPVIEFQSGGRIRLAKPVDLSRAEKYEIVPDCEAPVLAVRRLLQVPLGKAIPPITVRLGTTRGTNALLTRNGAKLALLITSPFEQLLEIGDQTRPDLFALDVKKAPTLASLVLPIEERIVSDGSVLVPINLQQARDQLQCAREAGCNSIAISLMHSFQNPEHELKLAELAAQVGIEHISVSHQLASVVEFVARTQTTVVDAYLSPIVREYFSRLCDQFGGNDRAELLVMTSAGGLVDWHEYSGKDCILSGPAGGVVALSQLQSEVKRPVIGLDMGGTSTDVCRAGQQAVLQYESTKAGVRILTPTLPIETVAAGGGSICWFDGVSLRVGPQSAGAFPGPACYGRGGPLTITDLNVVSGRIPPSQFPFSIDIDASWQRIDQLLTTIEGSLGRWTRQQLIDGLRKLANEQMADAVRSVSIQQGVDPREHGLVGFGGAAGQHICEIAEALGITQVIDHEDAGLLSAVGMGLARRRFDQVVPIYKSFEEMDFYQVIAEGQRVAESLADRILRSEGASDETVNAEESVGLRATYDRSPALPTRELHLELRYQGTDSTLTILLSDVTTPNTDEDKIWAKRVEEQFSQLHLKRYGYVRPNRKLEVVALRVSVSSAESRVLSDLASTTSPLVEGNTRVSQGNSADEIDSPYPCFSRNLLSTGQVIEGPAIILNSGSTLCIERGWKLCVDQNNILVLNRTANDPSDLDKSTEHGLTSPQSFDPVLRDCFAQRLSAIATQMGHVLQQTAVSVNIKQRRDFSCAVFDGVGQLLANAPHVPVHLGAMGVTVRAILERFPQMQLGDAFLCNDPYSGGSHLPDLTLVQPVFAEDSVTRPAFFVANRAHHADIGGIAPGSMSIQATRLEQEGVVISPFQIMQAGQSRLDQLKSVVDACPFPPRNWTENLADLHAQHAACERGCQLLAEYAQSIGWPTMVRYSDHLLDAGQARIERFIENELADRCGVAVVDSLQFSDALEDGTPICVRISLVDKKRLRIDFSGTGPTSSTNLNANPSIVTAAVLYVLRCIVEDDLPLNEGVLRAVHLNIPYSVLNPQPAVEPGLSPAVAAGNVETSQRVVDVLLGALGIAAASQGTMNNLLFGNSSFGFYETICGGSGATARGAGASAVHTHMTNTRLTDPEVLEIRYPVRLVQFKIRSGSGGAGRFAGGDGVVRSFQFLQPVTLSLLTSRRVSAPFGLAGGLPAKPGENWLEIAGEQPKLLPSNCQVDVPANSVLTLLTPGGGGYGEA